MNIKRFLSKSFWCVNNKLFHELYDYDIYNYVLQNMPDDMVAEQYRFKTQLPLKASKKKKKD